MQSAQSDRGRTRSHQRRHSQTKPGCVRSVKTEAMGMIHTILAETYPCSKCELEVIRTEVVVVDCGVQRFFEKFRVAK